jgi:hypothetical protein
MNQPRERGPRRRAVDDVIDRIEDRLHDAPMGFHVIGDPASREALAKSGFDEETARVWANWDGLDLASGELVLYSLAAIADATREAVDAGEVGAGDVVVGERRGALVVLPADPWEEGAAVITVTDGDRAPEASSVARLVLGVLGELSVLYGEDGEFREGLVGDDGALRAEVERKLLRRRLDFDEDAPAARFRLGQLLARDESWTGARAELVAVLKRAPSFSWASLELARVHAALGDREKAFAVAKAGAEAARDDGMAALLWAHAASHARDAEHRRRCAAEVKARNPGFCSSHVRGIQEAIEWQEGKRARELLALGLAVEPSHLELLALRDAVAALPDEPPPQDAKELEELAALEAEFDDDEAWVDEDDDLA